MEHRVGGQGTEGIDPFRPKGSDRRVDDIEVFPPDRPVFARMRIEARNGKPRLSDAEAFLAVAVGDAAGRYDEFLRQCRRDRADGDMDCYRDGAQFFDGLRSVKVRSEERRVGNAGVSTCSSRWAK